MATHSSIPPWEIPWTEDPDWLQSMGSQRAGHYSETKQQQQYSLLEDLKHSYTIQFCNIFKYYENVEIEDLCLPCAVFVALEHGKGIQKKCAFDEDLGLLFLLCDANPQGSPICEYAGRSKDTVHVLCRPQ